MEITPKPVLKGKRLKCSESGAYNRILKCVYIRMCVSERVKIRLLLILLADDKLYKTLFYMYKVGF